MICGFLWGRNVAGFPGAVITGLLNAVWFELVYFYTHPLSETFASAALVVGLYLIYPGRGVPSERRMFIGAAMMGLAAVLRPQLVPAVAVAVVAVGGIRDAGALSGFAGRPCAPDRAERPARLGHLGLAVSCSVTYVYYASKVASAAGINPFYSYIGWEVGRLGPVRHS